MHAIAIPTAAYAHVLGDLTAWAVAFLAARSAWHQRLSRVERLAATTTPSYFITLALGAAAGAWGFGSLNSLAGPVPTLSHSIAGALAGGIIAVELWKWRHGVSHSTGGPFVLPIALGIAIGRWGCLFTGLPDLTFGSPTNLPWAVNLGDGIARHPVQLYESASMALFALVYAVALHRGADWARTSAFHWLIIVYAAQRFIWEFFKPYPPLIGPFNLFHLLCLGLIIYGTVWINRARHQPVQ